MNWKKTVTKALTEVDKQAEIMDSKSRLKEAANKIPSGVLVNGGRLKTRKEAEAGPAEDTASGGVLAWGRSPKHVAGCVCDEKGLDPDCFRGPLGPVLDKFQMRTAASYTKHCKDPVAAAESDLLGRLLEWIREGEEPYAGDDYEERGAALLAESKEGP